MRRIYVEYDYDGLYSRFWQELGEIIKKQDFLARPEKCDLICFTGGADVSPELYGHRNLGSHNNRDRDEREIEIFRLGQEYEIPMTGICRGSQFLNVMAGGTMVQHLRDSHGGGVHVCDCLDGSSLKVTSSHHQMSVLGEGGVLLGWAERRLSPQALVYDGDLPKNVLDPADPNQVRVTEAFSYPEKRIFGIQHHPEWQKPTDEAWGWTLRQTRKICWGEE